MRSFKAKAALIALSCALASAMVVGCSGGDPTDPAAKSASNDGKVGGVGLNLELAEGITVNSVHYIICTGAAACTNVDPTFVIEGDINVVDAAATVSVLVGGLAPGSYNIALSATSTDGEVTCAGSAPFTISTGTTTSVTVDLTCTNESEDGVVIANGQISACTLDVIQYYTAAPLVTSTAGSIALTSQADDVDGVQPDYVWTSTGGTIVSAPNGEATLNCDGDAGTHTVTLTVSTEANSDIPGQEPIPCEQVVSFTVECVPITCGNGVVDAALGEDCDTAIDPLCPPDCTLPQCGDGDIEGTEVCDDGNVFNTDACPNDCSPQVCGDGVIEGSENCENPLSDPNCDDVTCQAGVCGNSVLEGTEQCDPPNGTTCLAGCVLPVVAVCGNGTVEGSETCDPGQLDNCGSSCTSIASSTCYSCQSTDATVSLYLNVCNFWLETDLPTGGPASGEVIGGVPTSRRDLCWELLQCAIQTECAENGTNKCYFGSSLTTPNGDCKAQVERALESTDPGTIGGRFTDYTFGGAGALDFADATRLNCAASCYTNPALPAHQ